MKRSVTATGALLGATLVAAMTLQVSEASGRQAAQEAGSFADLVLVQEVGLVVDFADVQPFQGRSELEPEDLVVLENGRRRDVTRIESIAQSPVPGAVPVFEGVEVCPWTFVIYVDTVLADPATIVNSALALGERSGRLVEMGCVDIVVADPIPEVAVAGSRSAVYIAKILVDLARAARVERDREPVQPGRHLGAIGPDGTVVAAQWDRLLSYMAGQRVSGPRALFLISDGFTLPVADMQVLSGRRLASEDTSGGRSLAEVVIDTAQTLSSYGWLTIAMPRAPSGGHAAEAPTDEFGTWRDVAEGRLRAGDRRSVINFFGTTRKGQPAGGLDDRLYEAYLLPSLAPLRALAEATSGEVVWSQEQLGDVLSGLGGRRLVWYQTPEPHDGRIRRLRVHLVDTARHLQAPWWKRSSTPDLVSESRLRQLLTDEPRNARLELEAEVLPSVSGDGEPRGQPELRVRVLPVAFGDHVSIGHVRISVGFAGSTGIRSFQHRIDYDAPPLGDDWQYSMSLAPVRDVTRLVVGVEDLSLEEWGAAIIDLATD